MCDVVYVYKTGRNNGQELKYSLRSLVNFKHDRVFIVGDLPDRATNVIHIPTKCHNCYRFKDVIKKYNTICNDDRISDDFVLIHDDMYILQPIDRIPYYIRGTLKQHQQDIYDKFGENPYWQSINNVYKLFPNGDSFDVHCPIVLNKKKFKTILDKYGDMVGSKRSIYCNEYGIQGVMHKGDIDCKVYMSDRKYNKRGDFLSSNDDIVRNMGFIRFINEKFHQKCIYEK